ncbi:hypothetical protein FJZ48_03200 [Candidatus Uhrbacteria bacterium]|nr:hypothetical protein [Candidatus Uhrbacteria bacterium]
MKQREFFVDLPVDRIRGLKVILDVDGTITPDRQGSITPEAVAKIEEIKKAGHRVFISSNGSPKHAEAFAQRAGVETIIGKKPFSAAFNKYLSTGELVTVIGDKGITDGLLARRLGADFIHVRRLTSAQDSVMAQISYGIDFFVSQSLPFVLLARPWQWIKNLLIFAPIFFAGNILSTPALGRTALAFCIFSFAASAVYIINDLFDRETDMLHPKKSRRPLAAKDLSPRAALLFASLIIGLDLYLVTWIPWLGVPIFLYIIFNLIYSRWLKHVAIIDVTMIAAFYILRIIAGGIAAGVPLSPWITLCTFFGALFIVIGKRRAEMDQKSRRAVLEKYSCQALDFMLAISASIAIISYGIWSSVGHASIYLVYSTIFVVIALLRLLNRIYISPQSAESPDMLVFKDYWILGSFISWALFVFFIFYLSL